ncbi:MAG: CopG family transcriptional regulator [Sphingorhabdus sp.]
MYSKGESRCSPSAWTKELEERLSAAAKRAGRTKTWFAKRAIEEYIDELEDYALLEEALKDYDPSQNISLENLRRELGLED